MFENKRHCSVKQLEYIAVDTLVIYEYTLILSFETSKP